MVEIYREKSKHNNKYKAQETPTKVYFALIVLFLSKYQVWQDEINNKRTKAV